jgi:hypothetical protein
MPVIQVRGEAAAQTITEARGTKYIRMWESFVDHTGKERKRLWTCWFVHELTDYIGTGELFVIEGDLSCKVGSYFNKTEAVEKPVVEYNMNNCVIVNRSGSIAAPEVTASDLADAPF